MKKFLLFSLLVLCMHFSYGQSRFWIAPTAGNWNDPANWSATSGGTGGASVPGAGELAVFDGAGGRNGFCNLNAAATVGGITVNGYAGIINLNGQTLTATGTSIFTTGNITNLGVAASLALNTTSSTIFNGTNIDVPVTGNSGDVYSRFQN